MSAKSKVLTTSDWIDLTAFERLLDLSLKYPLTDKLADAYKNVSLLFMSSKGTPQSLDRDNREVISQNDKVNRVQVP